MSEAVVEKKAKGIEEDGGDIEAGKSEDSK